MYERLQEYAAANGYTLHVRPARIGELAPKADCLVVGVEGRVIRAVYRVDLQQADLLRRSA